MGGLFTSVESSNNNARFRLCGRHIRDPRIIPPDRIRAYDLLPAPFPACVRREALEEEQPG